MTIPELFRQFGLRAAYIGEFKISPAKNGQTFWVNHRFVREMNAWGSESGIFVGTIVPDGSYRPKARDFTAKVQEVLQGISTSGIDYMIKNGKELGECQFCGRQLEDPESVHYGYGPVCAKKYHLPHHNRHGF